MHGCSGLGQHSSVVVCPLLCFLCDAYNIGKTFGIEPTAQWERGIFNNSPHVRIVVMEQCMPLSSSSSATSESFVIVGFVQYSVANSTRESDKGQPRQATWGEIDKLFLAPVHASQGYGRQLLQHALEKLQSDHRVAVVRLWVVRENLKARNFYQRQGFELVLHGTVRTII